MNEKLTKIKSDEDYQFALARIYKLWESLPNTPEAKEFNRLVLIVEKYESKKYPIPFPDETELPE